MKKLLLFLGCLFCTLQTFASFKVDDIYYNVLSEEDKTVEVTSGGYYGDISIPKSITYRGITYSVISIGDEAFLYCTNLTSINIPIGVTCIGLSAFEGCTSLTSINIPKSVTRIGKFAFTRCSSLPVIDNIRYADTYIVEVTDRLSTSYNIKRGTRFIGDYAFAGCESLSSIHIPESVIGIGFMAFYE